MYTKYIASRMASPRASPARLQHNKGVTVYARGISIVKYLSLKPDHLLQDTIRHCIMLTYNSLENIR